MVEPQASALPVLDPVSAAQCQLVAAVSAAVVAVQFVDVVAAAVVLSPS